MTAQDIFMRDVAPAVESHACNRFKRQPDREEKVQTALAFAWAIFVRMQAAGKDAANMAGGIAFAVKRAGRGRRFEGVGKGNKSAHMDASKHAVPLPEGDWSLALATRGNVADTVALKMDLEAFLDAERPREQTMAAAYAAGYQIDEVAEQHGLTYWGARAARYGMARRWAAQN